MKTVTFPGLNLELTLNPILVSIGPNWSIHWYGAIIAVGFILAVLWCCWRSKDFGITQDHLITMLYFALPLGIIGARLYYVLFEFKDLYYVEGDPKATLIRIVRIWDGGLAIYGGIIFAVLTAIIYCRVRKISFLAVADTCSMGLLIGQCIGRWGNFVNVEAFGSITSVPWRMAGPDVASYLLNTGQVTESVYQFIVDGTLGVHPTFFYESMWNLLGFILIALLLRPRRSYDGQMFFSYIAWYGLGRFWIEGLRTDSLYIPGTSLRVSQVIAIGSAVVCVIWLLYMSLVRAGKHTLYVDRVREAAASDSESGETGPEIEQEETSAEEPFSAAEDAEQESESDGKET